MKNRVVLIGCLLVLVSCEQKKEKEAISVMKETNNLIGSWKMIYADILENDSLQIKDLSASEFIKIINDDHFAFFNQLKGTSEGFYAGGGQYILKGDQYTETLEYISAENLRGHDFSFTVEIKGDTLIQYGLEEVKEQNIKRNVTEKYIRIK